MKEKGCLLWNIGHTQNEHVRVSQQFEH